MKSCLAFSHMADVIKINRAPVLTLWAAVVAERLGVDWEEALTLGRAVAGLNAYSKGASLGLYQPTPDAQSERRRKRPKGRGVYVAATGVYPDQVGVAIVAC